MYVWYIFSNKVTCLCRSSVLILGSFVVWCDFLCWPTHKISYTIQKIVFSEVTVHVFESVSSHVAFMENFIQCRLKIIVFNPLNAELNPICHLLALLGGATIVVVSRLRVNTCCLFLWLKLQSSGLFPRFRGIYYFQFSGWKRCHWKSHYHHPNYIVTNPWTLVLFLWNKCNKTNSVVAKYFF